jgi:hypothetical protein
MTSSGVAIVKRERSKKFKFHDEHLDFVTVGELLNY